MIISRQDYDQQPLAIKHGALLLWGELLDNYKEGDMDRNLYRFNNFLAQICYDMNQQRITCICTFQAH